MARGRVTVTDRDRGWAQLVKELRASGDLVGKAGVIGDKAAAGHMTAEEQAKFAGTKRDSGGRFLPGSGAKVAPPPSEGGMTNAEIALVNEFGSQDGRVPERSFIRSTFDRNR